MPLYRESDLDHLYMNLHRFSIRLPLALGLVRQSDFCYIILSVYQLQSSQCWLCTLLSVHYLSSLVRDEIEDYIYDHM